MQTSQPIQKRFKQDQGGAEVDQARGRAQLVHASHAEAEPEEVDHHEGEERHARDRQVQLARGNRVVDGDVPRALQRHHDVQHSRKQDVLLDDVHVEAEAGPVEADVEVSVAVEVIRSQEDVEVAHRVDDDEHEEEHGRAREANAVVGRGKVLLRHDGEEDLLHEAQHHVHQGAEPSPHLALALHADLAVLLGLRPVPRL